MTQLIFWWLILQLLQWGTLPISFRFFRSLPDRGYSFARPLGLLLVSYLLWLGASLGVLQNDLGGIVLVVLVVWAASAALLLRPTSGASLADVRAFLREKGRLVLTTELLFAACFVAWAVVRAYAGDKIMPAGGEKFMEMAFLNGILNSLHFPPLDPWLSGFGISYYYFGYVMMAVMTRLSGALPGVAFDLYDALLFALTATGAFGVVYNLVSASQASRGHTSRGALPAGLFGSLLVVGMGNLEGLVESLYSAGILSPAFIRWLAIPDMPSAPQVTGTLNPGAGWWWWRASRVLNDVDLSGQRIGINPITEFPFFSFLLGDNHPHVLALPFVMLAVAVSLQIFLSTYKKEKLSLAELTFASLLIGSLVFLNTWDFPIYLGLAALAYLAGRYVDTRRLEWDAVRRAIGLGMFMAAGALIFYLLFFTGFSSQAGGIMPYVFPPTRLAQYLVMFGPFIYILGFFLVGSLRAQNDGSVQPFYLKRLTAWWLRLMLGLAVFFLFIIGLSVLTLVIDQLRGGPVGMAIQSWLGGRGLWPAVLTILSQRLLNPGLFLTLSLLLAAAAAGIWAAPRKPVEPATEEMTSPLVESPATDPGALFVRLLALVGLALTFVLEFFYLRDNFGVRMNTVFKFYYQGWVLMALASAYAVWWMAQNARQALPRLLRNFFWAGSLILILGGLVYPSFAILSRTANFQTQPSLDGTSSLRRENPDDWAAIDWLRANVKNAPTILEAPGKSYNYEGRISAFTGNPAVLGWAVHEAQWRGNYDEQAKREPDISIFYTTPDASLAISILQKWQVKYVILGGAELRYIDEQCKLPERNCVPARALQKFNKLLQPVFSQGSTTIYRVPGGSLPTAP